MPDPLANFLFDRRKGHCEYFASAMAVMLRTVGIPSRVVTGFASGVYNPLTGWQVVRASDAHSWVEAWIAGRGWRTYDPTPADPSAIESPFMARTALFFDAAEQFWQDWVLSYDLERQSTLASRALQTSRGAKSQWMESAARWFSLAARSTRRICARGRGTDVRGDHRGAAGARRVALAAGRDPRAAAEARRRRGVRCDAALSAHAGAAGAARNPKAAMADAFRIRARAAGNGAVAAWWTT